MNHKVDYLIVGQGIAGSILAFQLLQKNCRFLIIDSGLSNSSTYVAAGVMNPLVLKRLTVSWRAQEFIDFNGPFYKELEQFLAKKFYYQIPLYKLIQSKEEKNFWKHRLNKTQLTDFMEEDLLPAPKSLKPAHDYFMGKVKQTAWLDTKVFLEGFRNYLLENEKVVEDQLDYSSIEKNHYKGIEFDKIVFCEGSGAIHNPAFESIPMRRNKGDLITIESDEIETNEMYKKQAFVLPIGNNQYKVGATYDRHFTDENPSNEKREELKNQLDKISNAKYKIVAHESGIRPAILDRRPVLGKCKNTENRYVFNGLGSRGCFMAPKLASEMVDFMEVGTEIPAEYNIQRFY